MADSYIPAGKILLCCLVLAMSPTAQADDQLDLAKYPQISPDMSLPRIFQGLRRSLKDPGSITDVAFCPEPRKVKFKDGQPVRWSYLFSLNARNGMGGYMGLQPYAAILFADGRTTIESLTMPGTDGFSRLANTLIEKDMAKCPFLAKDKLRELVERNM